MVIDHQAALNAVTIVLKNKEGQKTAKMSLACGAITAVSVFGGSILLGPLGIYAGATIGSSVAYLMTKDKFKSILKVIKEDMNEDEREDLLRNVRQFAEKFGVADAITLLRLAQGDVNFQADLLKIIMNYYTEWQIQQRSIDRQQQGFLMQ